MPVTEGISKTTISKSPSFFFLSHSLPNGKKRKPIVSSKMYLSSDRLILMTSKSGKDLFTHRCKDCRSTQRRNRCRLPISVSLSKELSPDSIKRKLFFTYFHLFYTNDRNSSHIRSSLLVVKSH